MLDWFEDLNDDNRFMNYGNCRPDDRNESNQDPTQRCVKLHGISGWWDVESYEWFDGFLQAESTQMQWNSCGGNTRGTIELSHK